MTNEQLYLFLKSYLQRLIDVLNDMYTLMPEDAPRDMKTRLTYNKINPIETLTNRTETYLEPGDFEALKPLQELIAELENEAEVLVSK